MIESLSLIVSGNLFHREIAFGKNKYLYTSVLAYGIKNFFNVILLLQW